MTAIPPRAFRIAPLAMYGFVVLASACATLRPRPDAVLAAITTAARSAAAVDTVWPGYRPPARVRAIIGLMSHEPGRGGIASPVPAVTLLRSANRASITNPGFDVAIRNRPVMLDGRVVPVHRLVVMLPDAPRLNGAAVTALTSPAPGVTYSITGRGTEIVVRPGALELIEVADNVVTVRIRPGLTDVTGWHAWPLLRRRLC